MTRLELPIPGPQTMAHARQRSMSSDERSLAEPNGRTGRDVNLINPVTSPRSTSTDLDRIRREDGKTYELVLGKPPWTCMAE